MKQSKMKNLSIHNKIAYFQKKNILLKKKWKHKKDSIYKFYFQNNKIIVDDFINLLFTQSYKLALIDNKSSKKNNELHMYNIISEILKEKIKI